MAQRKGRLLFADRLRGLALVVMIETHVVNSMLAEGLRHTEWFRNLNFINGLGAPSFLFVSGFVFLVSADRKISQFRGFERPFWLQLRRIGMVLAIAYLLHIPVCTFFKHWNTLTRASWLPALQVDVLHCIAATWLLLLITLLVPVPRRVYQIWLFTCAATFALLAPYMWSVHFAQSIPEPLAAYLNRDLKSLFPLFPWSGFMVAGALCASLFLDARRNGHEQRFTLYLFSTGLAFTILGQTLPEGLLHPGIATTSWQANPRTFVLRLGLVLLLLVAWQLLEKSRVPGDRWLLLVSRESLFVYVVHLSILFIPMLGTRSLARVVGRTLGAGQVALASLVLLVAMIAGAWGWNRLKARLASAPASS